MITDFDVVPTIIGILFLVIPAMLLGKICSRFKIPEIIGFVVAGMIFGPSLFGGTSIISEKPIFIENDFMISFWQISGIIILFSAGLHFTFHDLRRSGLKSVLVGIGGLVLPLILGYLISILMGFGWETSVIIGVTISATSIAVAIIILEEIKKDKSVEGNLLVSAAVLDDILGLAALSAAISIIVSGNIPSFESLILIALEEIGFWIMLLIGSVFFLPKIIHLTTSAHPRSLESRGINQGVALGSAFGIAAIAGSLGLNPIVGAFAAGMGLAGSKFVLQVRDFVGRLKVLLAPFFFAFMGTQVNLLKISEINLIFFILLLGIAVSSKIIGAGLTASVVLKNKKKGLQVGYAMVARGEIAFVTAGIGLVTGILIESVYSTVIFVILATILISPLLVRISYRNE